MREFLSSAGLDAQFGRAADLALDMFVGASHVRATLEEDPEEEDAPATVALRVRTSLPRATFRNARKDFYRRLRATGCARLCGHLAIARD